MKCEHLVYGKLVIGDSRGPVVPGHDPDRIGQSAGFPEDLVPFCHPSRTGLGTNDLFSFAEYPWQSRGGGIVCTRVWTGNKFYLLVGRIRGRSEAGEGISGRLYTQAHYICIEPMNWAWNRVPSFQQIPNNSLTASDNTMPILSLDDPEKAELPEDWLLRTSSYLTAIMSGYPISVQDWESDIPVFLNDVMCCLCAVPGTLAWRIPFGVGLVNMEDREDYPALAMGMYAKTPIRIIQGQLRIQDDVDLSLGMAYVRWLTEELDNHGGDADCAAVAKIVEHKFPDLVAWDARDINETWKDVARHISEIVVEDVSLTELGQQLQTKREVDAGKFHFETKKLEALTLILEYVDDGAQIPLFTFGTENRINCHRVIPIPGLRV